MAGTKLTINFETHWPPNGPWGSPSHYPSPLGFQEFLLSHAPWGRVQEVSRESGGLLAANYRPRGTSCQRGAPPRREDRKPRMGGPALDSRGSTGGGGGGWTAIRGWATHLSSINTRLSSRRCRRSGLHWAQRWGNGGINSISAKAHPRL